MIRWIMISSFLCLLFLNGKAESKQLIDAVSFGVGEGKTDINIYRLGLKKDFGRDFLTSDLGWLSGYFEGSLNYWEYDGEDIFAGAFSPVFAYYFGDKSWFANPYIEAGIGVAYISKTVIEERDLSTRFQFEDRVGGGIRLKNVDMNFRFMHYSNASIKQPNSGIDIFIFTISYIF